jgi:hypothetical protein
MIMRISVPIGVLTPEWFGRIEHIDRRLRAGQPAPDR